MREASASADESIAWRAAASPGWEASVFTPAKNSASAGARPISGSASRLSMAEACASSAEKWLAADCALLAWAVSRLS